MFRRLVNQAVSSSARHIWGIKLTIHRTRVFFRARRKVSLARTVLKFRKISPCRKCQVVLPRPLQSVKPKIAVLMVGYRWKIRKITTKGMLNK